MNTDIYNYKSPKLTVDVVIFVYNLKNLELKVLLVNRDSEPFNSMLSLPGGFIHEGETGAETAHRVLEEKTGISSLYIEQVRTFDNPKRDPRGYVFSMTYLALVNEESLPSDINLEKTKIISIDEILKSNYKLAFDHTDIIKYSFERLKNRISYSNFSAISLPKLFTLPDLQNLFEIILGSSVDKRNFRKKIIALDFVTETDKLQTGQSKRPAKLYKNKYKKLVNFDSLI